MAKTGDMILRTCAALVEAVDQGAPEATAEIELGDGVEGFCFEITCRKVSVPKPSKKKKNASG